MDSHPPALDNSGKYSPQWESAGETADHPKTVVVVAVVRIVPVTIRTTTVRRIVVPRTAALLPTPISLLC
jgi:hypothetical protein